MASQRVAHAVRIDAGLRVERNVGKWQPAPRGESSARTDRMRAQREILLCAFEGLEEASDPAARERFEQAGRSQHFEQMAQLTDLSAPATVQRILAGITGYVYAGFRLAYPAATVADFDRFTAEVLRGLERGLDEARSEIDGFGALTPELAKGIDRTEELVREGLEVFISDERRRIEGAGAAAR